MNIQWQKLVTKILIWLVAEVLLSLIGLDDLADYSEFVFDYRGSQGNNISIAATTKI